MSLQPSLFTYVSELLKREAAIVLGPDKSYLVETRLKPVARDAGFASLDALILSIQQTRESELMFKVVDALTTNETSFYRDETPFELLRTELLPEMIERRKGQRDLSIWSAAASTGQEAYSIAILIREHFPQLMSWNVSIFATDISPTVLNVAAQGDYSAFEVRRGLSEELRGKYFKKDGIRYKVNEDIRRMVHFQRLNLAQPWPSIPQKDIIFLRNVLIYFDVETKRSILDKMGKILAPDGALFLGAAETTLNVHQGFERASRGKGSYYRFRG